MASYALLLAFVALNARRLSVVLVGVGTLLNAIAIVANGGYMPASTRALEVAGVVTEGPTYNNSVVAGEGAHLLMLGDVMAVPSSFPVFSNVFSIGDVLIAVGVAMLLASGMRASVPSPEVRTAEAP